jgi:hypothetical protein
MARFDPATDYLLFLLTEFKLTRSFDRRDGERRNEILLAPVVVPVYTTPSARTAPPPFAPADFLQPTLDQRDLLTIPVTRAVRGYKWLGRGHSLFNGYTALTPNYLRFDIHIYEVDDAAAGGFWSVLAGMAGDTEVRAQTERLGLAAEQIAREYLDAAATPDYDLDTDPSGAIAAAGALALRLTELLAAGLGDARIQHVGTTSGELFRDENFALKPTRLLRRRRVRHREPSGYVLKLRCMNKEYDY